MIATKVEVGEPQVFYQYKQTGEFQARAIVGVTHGRTYKSFEYALDRRTGKITRTGERVFNVDDEAGNYSAFRDFVERELGFDVEEFEPEGAIPRGPYSCTILRAIREHILLD